MKTYTNEQGPKWTKYYEDSEGKTPVVKHHITGKITLMSPSDESDRVDIYSPEENLFVLDTLKRLLSEWFSLENFQDRVGDLVIRHSQAAGLSISRRGIHKTQFHCVTNQSVEFIVAALVLIEAERTAS